MGLAAAACALLAAASAAAETLETAVKATYLYKLAPFVDWPPGALGAAGAPFTICVIGHDPFGAMLDRAVAGQQVFGRAIVVRRMAVASAGAPCTIAYLGSGVRDALKALGDAPVLTVSDGAGSASGVIDFVLDKNRVRFRVDAAQAQARRLKIGSQLLGLAITVNGVRAERAP